MSDNVTFILASIILFILFYGDPDVADAVWYVLFG